MYLVVCLIRCQLRELTDDQMECMQFGIRDYAKKQVEEVPFCHY